MASRGESRIMNEETAARADYYLGCSYYRGLGTAKDYPRAAHWFAKADKGDNFLATVELAKMHIHGHAPHASASHAVALLRRTVRDAPRLSSTSTSALAAALVCLADLHRTGNAVDKDAQKALALLREARALGHPNAIVPLGDCYRDGVGVPADPARAVTLYRDAVGRKLTPAFARLAECAAAGIGMAPDLTVAFNLFTEAARLGDTAAYFPLARAHACGLGTPVNLTLALRWFRRAADADDGRAHPRAACIVARCYETGTVVGERCPRTAARYWKIAADAGVAKAQVALADCYSEGLGVDKDPKRAFQLFQAATDAADPDAFVGLGECYLDGHGVAHDRDKGVSFLQRAENIGSTRASLVLARRYLHGVGLQRSEAEAVNYFTKASVTGSPDAAYSLALCYLDGRGVAPDLVRAVEMLKLASQRGLHIATMLLARCLRHGVGTAPNVAGALELTRQAADGGDLCARRDLALCYLRGTGCLPNPTEARKLLDELLAENDPVAMRYLADLHADGASGTAPKDPDRAVRLYEKAFRRGDPVAGRRLAFCHRDGVGVLKRNDNHAFVLLERAAKMHDKGAVPALARCLDRGLGVKPNPAKAASLYEQAVNDGRRECNRSLLDCLSRIANSDDAAAESEVKWLRELKGNDKDQYTKTRLAYLLYKGIGVARNRSAAIELIENLPADKRTWPAMRILASCHMQADECHEHEVQQQQQQQQKQQLQTDGEHERAERNEAESREAARKAKVQAILTESAERGMVESKAMLGKLLLGGFCGPERVEEGVQLLEAAAGEGSSKAALILGELYSRGNVRIGRGRHGECAIDRKKAFDFYTHAAKDHPYGQYRLARCHLNTIAQGTGNNQERENDNDNENNDGNQDPSTSSQAAGLRLLQSSSERGCALAQLAMCEHYERASLGVEQDLKRAFSLYKAAVHRVRGKTRARAMYRYGRFLLKHGLALGSFPSQAAVEQRAHSMLKEAKIGHYVSATNDLGVLLIRAVKPKAGESTEAERGASNKDAAAANSASNDSNERDDQNGGSNSSALNARDARTAEKMRAAYELFESAGIEGGVVRAIANMAICKERGLGVPRDGDGARELYERAAQQGDVVARAALALRLIEEEEQQRQPQPPSSNDNGNGNGTGTGTGNANEGSNSGSGNDNDNPTGNDNPTDNDNNNNLNNNNRNNSNIDNENDANGNDEDNSIDKDNPNDSETPNNKDNSNGNDKAISNGETNSTGTTSSSKAAKGRAELAAIARDSRQPEAMTNLARLYERGVAGDKDCAKALALYKEAACVGSAVAMFNVAACFEDGVGTEVDEKSAAEWYRRAAHAGLPEAVSRAARYGRVP